MSRLTALQKAASPASHGFDCTNTTTLPFLYPKKKPCRVCDSGLAIRLAVTAALLNDYPIRKIAKELRLSPAAVQRHKRCIPQLDGADLLTKLQQFERWASLIHDGLSPA